MDLATAVVMDKTEAAVHAVEYRDAFLETGDEPLRMIAEGYEALAEGVPLIDLPAAIAAAGLDSNGHPRMAACRADARICFVSTSFEDQGSRTVRFHADNPQTVARPNLLEVPGVVGAPNISVWDQLGAVVPITPPAHRPHGKGMWRNRMLHLRNFVILWEVEEGGWQRRSVNRRAPRDPALLRHISGNLYAVLAVWDLTDLERIVLEGARR